MDSDRGYMAQAASLDKSKLLRVLHIVGRMDRAGLETRLMELLRISRRENVQFTFFATRKGVGWYEQEIKAYGAQVLHLVVGKNLPAFAWRFYRLLKHGKYDVVHSHVLFFSGICLTIARLAGVKKRIDHIRTTWDDRELTLLRRIYRSIARYLVIRNATDILSVSKDALRVWFGESCLENPKFKVIYNGFDSQPFHCESDPNWLRAEFGIPSGYKTILHVGRFEQPKNHAKLVSIAESYLAKHGMTCFILVGDGGLRREIEDSVRAKGLWEKFRFAGVRADVPRITKSADALLFPSVWEGFSGVVVEAVAAGLPMVVSDLPSTKEVFDICGKGELLSIDSPDIEWANALERAVNSPHQEQWLAELEKSVFSLDKAWQNLLSVYRSD
jgi:glycosyltransferase EpsF